MLVAIIYFAMSFVASRIVRRIDLWLTPAYLQRQRRGSDNVLAPEPLPAE